MTLPSLFVSQASLLLCPSHHVSVTAALVTQQVTMQYSSQSQYGSTNCTLLNIRSLYSNTHILVHQPSFLTRSKLPITRAH